MEFPINGNLRELGNFVRFPMEFPNPYRDYGIGNFISFLARNLRELALAGGGK